jgi:hypothetical protein
VAVEKDVKDQLKRKSNESVLNEIGEKINLLTNMMESKIKWIGHLIQLYMIFLITYLKDE